MHLADGIEVGLLDARKVLAIDEDEYAEIIQTIEYLDAVEDGKLKPVYEELEEKYDYGVLKCVMAGLTWLGIVSYWNDWYGFILAIDWTGSEMQNTRKTAIGWAYAF